MNRQRTGEQRGATLIVLIMVISFLFAVGMLVLSNHRHRSRGCGEYPAVGAGF